MEYSIIAKYLKKSFLTGSLKTIIVSLAVLVFLPLIINQIGMEKYGLVSITMIFGSSVMLVDLGISKTVTLLIGKSESIDEKNQIVSDTFIITLCIILLIVLLCLFIIFNNLTILGNSINISNNLYNFIILFGFLFICTTLLINFCVAILESYLLMHYVNIGFSLSSIGFHVILLLIGVYFDSDILLISSPVLSNIIVFFFYFILIKLYTPLRFVKPNLSRIKKIIPISLKFFGISIASSISKPANNYILLLLTGNPVFLGVFEVGHKIANIASSLLNSISQPLYGVFSNFKKENEKKAFFIAKKVSVIIAFLYLIGIISFYFLGGFITQVIDKINYSLLNKVSYILLISVAFNALSEPFYRVFLGFYYINKAILLKLSGLLFNIVFFLLLFKQEDLFRVILSYGLSIMVSSTIIIIYSLYFSTKQKNK